jgi:AcrR family transcriptional regulator
MLRIALEQFCEIGYIGTSLQNIADRAGYSKSSVLYHFASKEALLEAAIAPAVDQLDALLTHSINRISSPELREAFVEEFIDYLLEYRLQAHVIINRGSIDRLSESFMAELPTTAQRIRLGVALAGAAYVLVAVPPMAEEVAPLQDVRAALIAVVAELVTPLSQQQSLNSTLSY